MALGPRSVLMVLITFAMKIRIDLIISYVSFQKAEQMSQQSLPSIFDKIRTICKECNMQSMPTRFTTHDDTEMLEGYAKAMEIIRAEVFRVHKMDQEYTNLESMLQRYETELRRRAGIENQLRLQLQVCKQQLDQLQNEKLELLDNTKNYIINLKRVNEQLFQRLAAESNKSKSTQGEIEKQLKKGLKQKAQESNKLFYRALPKRQQSIKQITKTQYIERQHNRIELKKNRRINNFKAHNSIMTEIQDEKPIAVDNFHTFQDTNIPNTQRRLKKANKCLTKGISRKDKSRDRDVKSPYRGNVMLLKNRMELMTKHIPKNRKHNRSIYSVLSAQHSQSQLEFQ